jgi:hypothetical protein
MKWPRFNAFLLVLNLMTLGLVGYFVYTRTPTPPGVPSIAGTAVPETEPAAVKEVVPQIVTVTNEFQWRQLESEDYKSYIERLRSIGCPEQTIRDIVIADLDKLLAPRVQAIYGRRPDVKYWQPEEEELANDHDHREWSKQERAIDQEKRQVIQELMGVDLVRERLKQKGQVDYYERRLGFLPEEKRNQVRMLLEQCDEQEQAIRDKEWQDGEILNAADRAVLRQLQEERRGKLAGVLSPAEQEQLDLWLSPTANAVRHSLYGMEGTEEEFLSVYRLRKGFDDYWSRYDMEMMTDGQREQWEQARNTLEVQIRQQLGDQRYADLKRGEDEDFHHLNATVSHFKLPSQKALEVYELKKSLQQMRDTVYSNPDLGAAQKQQALKAMADEAERAVRALLGDKAFNYYLWRGQGNWIKN